MWVSVGGFTKLGVNQTLLIGNRRCPIRLHGCDLSIHMHFKEALYTSTYFSLLGGC